MLKHKKGIVSVWIGDQVSKAALDDYIIDESGDLEKGQPINRFAKDAKEKWYDHDSLEVICVKGKNKPIRQLAKGCSFFSQFIAPLESLAKSKNFDAGNCVVLLFDYELAPGKWPVNSPLKYIGHVPYEDLAPKPEKLTKRKDDHTRGVWDVTVSPDGKHGVSFGFDDSFRVWEMSTGKHLTKKSSDGELIGWLSANTFAVAGSPQDITCWQLEKNTVRKKVFKTTMGVSRPQIAQDKSGIFWVHERPVFGRYDKWAPEESPRDPKNPVQSVIALPSNRCVTMDLKKNMKVWDLASGKVLKCPSIPNAGELLCSYGDRQFVCTTAVVDIETGKRVKALAKPTRTDIATMLSGKKASWLVGVGGSTVQSAIRIWDVTTGAVVSNIVVDEVNVKASIATEAYLAFTVSHNANLHVFDLTTAKKTATWRIAPENRKVENSIEDGDGSELTAVCASPNGKHIIAGEKSGRVFILKFEQTKFKQLR